MAVVTRSATEVGAVEIPGGNRISGEEVAIIRAHLNRTEHCFFAMNFLTEAAVAEMEALVNSKEATVATAPEQNIDQQPAD